MESKFLYNDCTTWDKYDRKNYGPWPPQWSGVRSARRELGFSLTGTRPSPPSPPAYTESMAIMCRQITSIIPRVVTVFLSFSPLGWHQKRPMKTHQDSDYYPAAKRPPEPCPLVPEETMCKVSVKHSWLFQQQWYLQSWVRDGAFHLSLEVLKIPSLPWMSMAAKWGKLDFSSFLAVIRWCHPSPLIEQCQSKLTKPGNLCKIQRFTT